MVSGRFAASVLETYDAGTKHRGSTGDQVTASPHPLGCASCSPGAVSSRTVGASQARLRVDLKRDDIGSSVDRRLADKVGPGSWKDRSTMSSSREGVARARNRHNGAERRK